MPWKLRSNRSSHYGFPLGTSISRNIYGRTGKHFSYNIVKSSCPGKDMLNDTNCFLKEDSIEHVIS